MDQNETPYPDDRRGADRRETAQSAEATIWVLRTKVDILTSSLADIKETLKRIVDIVGVISIIEINAKQLSKESTALEIALDTLAEQVSKLEKNVAEDIQKASASGGKKHDDLHSQISKLRTEWEEKYNMARGMWLVVSAMMTLTAGSAFLYVKSYTTKVDDSHAWIERYKLEKSIRDRPKGDGGSIVIDSGSK